MGECVDSQQLVVIRASDYVLLIILQDVCQGLERLGGGVGPRLPAPPAAGLLQQEHRIVALHRERSEISVKVIAVHQEFPGCHIAWVRKIELPRNETDLFPAMRAARELPA